MPDLVRPDFQSRAPLFLPRMKNSKRMFEPLDVNLLRWLIIIGDMCRLLLDVEATCCGRALPPSNDTAYFPATSIFFSFCVLGGEGMRGLPQSSSPPLEQKLHRHFTNHPLTEKEKRLKS
ncbi:hypothetical protein OUZ56_014568 [Daphnia magna]|uniref:Uncharacterized protein n=1 Tax=Daphnia magna TaxID=35525 RepID=A0ABR0AK58_9CRUS|nr:hypothetical protein OUZ56_014568 [Daphnia magna]